MGRLNYLSSYLNMNRRGRMVVEFTTTCAIVAYHHYWMLELFRQSACYIFFSFYYRILKKKPAELQLLKKIWLWLSSVIKIVKIKYNRINIKSWLVQPHLKHNLTFFYTCTSRWRSFITTLFHSSVHFVPVLVKGLYQTESYSLHVMQLIRI